MEPIEILSRIFLFILVFIASKLFITIALDLHDDRKKRKRREDATLIYNRRKREFDYHNNPDAWKRWRYINTEICDLVEGRTWY